MLIISIEKKLQQNKLYFEIINILAVTFMILPGAFIPSAKYVRYGIPVFMLFFVGSLYVVNRSYFKAYPLLKSIKSYLGVFLLLYIVIFLYSLILTIKFQYWSNRMPANMYFIFSPLLAVLLVFYFYIPAKKSNIKFIFYSVATCYLLTNYSAIYDLPNYFKITEAIELLQPTGYAGESSLGILFGLFYIYFLNEKDRSNMLLSIIFVLLTSKRSVILGILIISLLRILLIRFDVSKYPKYIKASIASVFVIINIYSVRIYKNFAFGNYDDWMREAFGRSANSFMQGRQYLYKNLFNAYGDRYIEGVGIGVLDDFFSNGELMYNVHSDILKNYFEFGIIFFVVWLFIFYYSSMFSYKALQIVMFMNLVYAVGNSFVYFIIQYFLYFFLAVYYVEYCTSTGHNVKNRTHITQTELKKSRFITKNKIMGSKDEVS